MSGLVPVAVVAAMAVVLWLLWRRRILKWFTASVPWWMVANDSGWYQFGACVLTLGGFIALAVGPTLPGRIRRRNVTPLEHLANGPLTPVDPRVYRSAQSNRFLSIATVVLIGLAAALGIAAGAGVDPATTAALAISSLIIAMTFAFGNWFAGRVRLRVDDRGLHSRIFFAEQTIPWKEVAGVALRYVFLPGAGVRVIYYCTYSPTHEFAFPSSMPGAKELQRAIEGATGLTWPEPEITATM